MNKKIYPVFLIILLDAVCLFCATPKWLDNLEAMYPSEEFLRTIGEGSTLKQAENEAITELSQSFNTKVKVVNQAIKDYNSIVTEEKTDISKKYSFHQEAQISSKADLFCLKFSEPYFDKKQKRYFIVGYINKKNASKYYQHKIDDLMLQIKTIIDFAKKEHEPLYSILNFQKASKLTKIGSYYIDAAVIINPEDSEKYKEYAKLNSLIQGNVKAQRNRGTFMISCNDSRYNSVCVGISSILESSGFIISQTNPSYRIFVDLHFSEEEYEAGNFVRPDICITVRNSVGKEIESYSKLYPRYTHKNLNNAYKLALVRIQQDLEENFLLDYRGEE